MGTLQALGDVQRIVGWEELPDSVRAIPADFDPSATGVLMHHQSEWILIAAPIKVCDKGRRTGITFAEALDDTVTAASSREAGGDNVYYIPDAKEKGLEFIGYCAKFARVIATAQGQGVSGIEEFLFEDQDERGNTKHITAWRIRFASGFSVVALSSRPAAIRGLQGIVVIDEAAFHTDVQAVLDAATALLIWGGKLRIISTHNGKKNAFNQLCKDIEAGLYGPDAWRYTATFDDAVANGLYERVCLKTRETPTPEGKKAWYTRVRRGYGSRVSAMREELDAIPRDGGGKGIPGVWIERAMCDGRPVLRLALDESFIELHEDTRIAWCDDWIGERLKPLIESLDARARYAMGMDYARHRHFSVIVPAEIDRVLTRSVPFVVELHNVPTRQQEQILWSMMDGVPNFPVLAVDATGPGQTIAEYTWDRYGEGRVHQVTLSRPWYGEWMPKFTGAFEDGTIQIPLDDNLDGDLRMIEAVDGIQMVPKIERKDLKEPDLKRHGDFAIAGALMWFASLQNPYQPATYEPVSAPAGRAAGGGFMRPRNNDDAPAHGWRVKGVI
ncbi:hypothetical protein RM530_03940 [Algiphilus sp. W345]|uniref:Mu-like prophage FluMu protein gp28 n=1 Tax=Banduia mediterranea TaxID=3075609 RepID=A0ABU2WGX4_9GAMM|nr:hypothetical protein [Algiphilus sp. W345]MDT0496516.1 hypothetical protein [Algiphilus sp. W345]